MLVNGMMYSSEIWHGLKPSDIARLEQVDTYMLSFLASGHPKCPKEFHFLETGSLMLRHILTMRRLIYHHHIITRTENEIIRKIYNKQKQQPSKGDWINLLKEDFAFIEENMDEMKIAEKSEQSYKNEIKEKVKNATFKEYIRLKKTHSKIKDITYDKFEIAPYLKSPLFTNEEVNILYALRSRSYKCKINFKNMYRNNLQCKLKCVAEDSPEHIFYSCKPILQQLGCDEIKIPFNHIFDASL